MGKRLIFGTISGAVIVFIWYMISWMALPWHASVMSQFDDEGSVSAIIMENTTGDGVYILPNMKSTDDAEAHANQVKSGPVIFTTVQRNGFDLTSPTPYILAFIIQLIAAFLVTYLLLLSKAAGYWHGVWFITIMALAFGVVGVLPSWIWWGYSIGFVGLEMLDILIAWFLASLAISAVAKRS